jgi:hypothetical protein
MNTLFSRLFRDPWKKETSAIRLFCPEHHTIPMPNKIGNTSIISTTFIHVKSEMTLIWLRNSQNQIIVGIEIDNQQNDSNPLKNWLMRIRNISHT